MTPPRVRRASAAAFVTGRARAAVLLCAALWGTTGTVAHFAPAGSSPFAIGLSTFGFGALVLAACSWKPLLRVLRMPGAWRWLIVGGLGAIIYPTAYYESMSLAGVAVGNIVALGSGPLFAGVLEWVVERRAVTPRWGAAAAVAVVGLTGILVGETGGFGVSGPGTGSEPLLGLALALFAGFGYAVYTVAAARLISLGAPSSGAMSAVFLAGAVVMVPAFFVGGPGPLFTGHGPFVLAYLALVPFALAYALFGVGLRRLSASTATLLALFEPIVATVLAVVIVGERPPALTWIGLGLLAVSIAVLALRLPRRRAAGTER